MCIPPTLNEADVLAVIEDAVRLLAPRFTPPGTDVDDVAQEARIFALECLVRYDPRPDGSGRPTRPLANFVFSHTRNRLRNYLRDHWRRNDAPCRQCWSGTPCRPDGTYCPEYAAWAERQERKARVKRPLCLDHVDETLQPHARSASTVEEDVQTAELLRRIDENLDVSLRADYLRLRAGKGLSKNRRQAVEEAIREVLSEDVA